MGKIKTQLGGKFSRHEDGLFDLKRKLEEAGIIVEFPFNDGIIGQNNGIDVTFIPTKERSFYHVEIEFFSAIRNNPIHIVHNKFIDKLGYIGESASIEMLYAIMHSKPIVILYKPMFSDLVSEFTKKIINRNIHLLHIVRIDQSNTDKIREKIMTISNMKIQYELNINDEVKIVRTIDKLLQSYK